MKKYIIILFATLTASSFAITGETLNAYKGSERYQLLRYDKVASKPVVNDSINSESYFFTSSVNNANPTTGTKIVTYKYKNPAGITQKYFYLRSSSVQMKIGFYNKNSNAVLGNIQLEYAGSSPCSGTAKNGFMNAIKWAPNSNIYSDPSFAYFKTVNGSFRKNNSLLNDSITINAAVNTLKAKLIAQGYEEIAI
jgi:hypothetical protein